MQSTHGRAAGELYGSQFSLEAVSEAEVYHLIALHSDHNLVGCAVLRDFLPAYILPAKRNTNTFHMNTWHDVYNMTCSRRRGVLLAKCVVGGGVV